MLKDKIEDFNLDKAQTKLENLKQNFNEAQ